jgi:hypothetical protein
MAYQFASGYNNAGNLATLDPQPRSTGIRAGRRVVTGDGLSRDDGFMAMTWEYTFLTKTGTYSYSALLNTLGLDSAVSVECTVRVPTNDRTGYANYNAVITRPDVGNDATWTLGKLVTVRFELSRMVAL